MQQRVESWSIPGADNQLILGDAHLPDDEKPLATALIAHGFKGYKDYGMLPRVAAELAGAGCLAHRLNFSHSGMTNRIETFERPDLFERDTWNKQVFDLRRVIETKVSGSTPSAGEDASRYFIFGHSRGGVTALLTAGRFANDPSFPQPAGIITAAAPSTTCSFSAEVKQQLLRDGWLDSPSSRTGQTLRIGRAFLQEQLDDPSGHDLLELVSRIKCPIIIIHGDNDPTVPLQAAHEIAAAAGSRGKLVIIPGGDHVFNTPNSFPLQPPPEASPQLAAMICVILEVVQS